LKLIRIRKFFLKRYRAMCQILYFLYYPGWMGSMQQNIFILYFPNAESYGAVIWIFHFMLSGFVWNIFLWNR